MSQELAPRADAAMTVREDALPIAAILRAAQDPNVDVVKMEALVGLYERMQDRAAKQAYNAAMVACQSEMPRVTKDGKVRNKAGGVQSRYATLERIDEEVRPIYERHGFSVSYNTGGMVGNKLLVKAVVRHSAGHAEPYEFPIELDSSGAKTATHGAGSTMSFGKRYLLKAIFNIIEEGEDDDGNKGQSYERITKDQVNSILDLLNAAGRTEGKLLEWAKVEKLEDLPTSRFGEIVALLKKAAKS